MEFVSESNVTLFVGFDVCQIRHLISLIFPLLGVILRVSTALHLPVVYIDDIIRSIAIYNDTYKFAAFSYSILQEFTVDNKVMITSHPEAVEVARLVCRFR